MTRLAQFRTTITQKPDGTIVIVIEPIIAARGARIETWNLQRDDKTPPRMPPDQTRGHQTDASLAMS
jgi:hypothetical protein